EGPALHPLDRLEALGAPLEYRFAVLHELVKEPPASVRRLDERSLAGGAVVLGFPLHHDAGFVGAVDRIGLRAETELLAVPGRPFALPVDHQDVPLVVKTPDLGGFDAVPGPDGSALVEQFAAVPGKPEELEFVVRPADGGRALAPVDEKPGFL